MAAHYSLESIAPGGVVSASRFGRSQRRTRKDMNDVL